MKLLSKIATFLKEVKIEMRKVTWPTRQETVKYTLLVVGVSAAVAIFLGGMDLLFTWLLDRFVI